MPFKHFIQKIEGRLPQYTVTEPTDKPKFPYTFDYPPWHRMREFINGEYNEDEERTTTVSEAFLWRATPQGHGYWVEWTDYTFEELPDEQFDIVFSWAQQYDLDLGEEVEFESVEEDTEYVGRPISPGSVVWIDEFPPWSDEDIRTLLEEFTQPTR